MQVEQTNNLDAPSDLSVEYTWPTYGKLGFPSKINAQFCMCFNTLFLTSRFKDGILRIETKLSMNSLEETSTRKWSPPFLMQVSVNFSRASLAAAAQEVRRMTHTQSQQLHIRILVVQPPLQRTHCVLWLHRLGTNLIAYLEIQRNVLRARW